MHLGDLGRHRVHTEDDKSEDRDTWTNVARFWYNKSTDKDPTIGRVYHHLGVIARPYSLEQLSLYMRSLTCITPFENAQGSVRTLFDSILAGQQQQSPQIAFIRAHGIIFTMQPLESLTRFDKALKYLENAYLSDKYISQTTFKMTGAHIAVSNIAALFGTPKPGEPKSRLRLAYEKAQTIKEERTKSDFVDSRNLASSMQTLDSEVDDIDLLGSKASATFISNPSRLASAILAVFLKRTKDQNVYPLLHVYLTFIWSLLAVQQTYRPVEKETVWKIIEKDIPWVTICSFLNTLLEVSSAVTPKVWAEDFPKPDKGNEQPLPEDFIMRGQLYTRWYFPDPWFTGATIDFDERMRDLPSMVPQREERILWLGNHIASVRLTTTVVNPTNALQHGQWIRYDKGTKSFVITDYVKELANVDAELQPELSDHGSIMSDAGITQYTPSEYSTMSDEAPCLTPGTASNAPSESHDVYIARSPGESEIEEAKARTAEFVNRQVCPRLQRLQSEKPISLPNACHGALDLVSRQTILRSIRINEAQGHVTSGVAK